MVWVPGPVQDASKKPTCLPFILTDDHAGDGGGQFAVGGLCFLAKAAAALLVGDAVFWSAAGTVNKSTVAGDRLKRAGILVGGAPRTLADYVQEAMVRSGDIGGVASAANDTVLVCYRGVCVAVADGVIAAGAQVTFSAGTAGRITAAASAAVTDAMGVVGTAIDAAAANGDKIRILVSY